jgi:hypothetical protein
MFSKINKKILFFITLVLLAGFASLPVLAADLNIKTANSTYKVGDTILAKIILVSTDQPANAISGVLTFPADKLIVSSLDKSSSLINMWVQEPSFSNANGQVSFEGAILNPGFKGSTGQMLIIVFKAKKAGTVTLAFDRGAILASDGQGTAILNKLGQVSFSILPKEATPVPKPIPPLVVEPVATSSATATSPVGFFPEVIEPEPVTMSWWESLFIWPMPLVLALGLFVLILLIILIWLSASWRNKKAIYYSPAVPPVTPALPVVNMAEALVVFSGRAYPANDVSVLLAEQTVAKTRTGPDGRFEISFNHLLPGQYNFVLKAFDNLTNQTAIQMFPTTLTAGVTIRNNDIFLVPPAPKVNL